MDAVDLSGFDQGRDAVPSCPTFFMTREERVFAAKRDGADQVFDWVAIHLDATVGQECLQLIKPTTSPLRWT